MKNKAEILDTYMFLQYKQWTKIVVIGNNAEQKQG